jgi:hypothetical protein
MMVSMVLWSRALPAWNGPLTRSSLAGLFLGCFLWLFCRPCEHDGCQC